MYRKYIKRLLDIIISLFILVLFCWLYLIVWVLVKIKLGSPAVFTQERPGTKGKIFKLYKFRSMTNEKDENGELLPDEDRLTHFGKVLRATSLDELPEFVNILKGDMSFIGPRPLLVRYLPYYNETEMRRHDVRPGLTGLAQVNGRNQIGWETRFAYDVEYVDNCSFIIDLKILGMTIGKVLKRSGVQQGNEQVADDFDVFRQKQNFKPLRKIEDYT